MNLFISNTYESMSAKAAEAVMQIMQSKRNPLLCPASGDSPTGLYKELIHDASKFKRDISGWYFVGLDEWLGMNGDDEGSCRFHLNNQLFNPLHISENNICFFDGKTKDLNAECDKVESFITKHGGIDVAIVGLGMNGHVGMNEPGTSSALRSHVTEIDAITQQVGQKYFKEKTHISKGITLGIANIMEARNVLLIVSGNKKAEIVRRLLEGEISEQLPASLLRNHPNCSVYLDAEAASLLEKK
ncbi:MAG TPA: glucosamine-6-phosphate deaminase [Hanamia sp.]|jgi:6-phosphogluconolactonase/Glucosamine-6-phosphate isomerase/deaminase